MAYELYIGDRTFSSWSLRGWLMLKSFDIPFKSQMLGLYTGSFEKDVALLAPARRVPILKTQEGHIVFDTLAIADLAGSEVVERAHIAEAASFRLAAGRGPSQPRKSRKAAAAAQPEKMAMANESSP